MLVRIEKVGYQHAVIQTIAFFFFCPLTTLYCLRDSFVNLYLFAFTRNVGHLWLCAQNLVEILLTWGSALFSAVLMLAGRTLTIRGAGETN